VGGVLGNRIAGRGNRTLGTLLGGALGAAGGSALGCKLQKNDQAKAERAMEEALAKDFSVKAIEGITVDADDLNNDIHASAAYRAHVVTVLAKRAVAARG
jgi:hypothetical protein